MAYHALSSDFYVRWQAGADKLDSDTLLFCYELIAHAGFVPALFYDRKEDDLPGPAGWLNFINQEKFWVFVLYDAHVHTPLAMLWLEGCTHTGAQRYAHFTGFATSSTEWAVEGSKLLLPWIGQATGVRQLIGITPALYRHALRYAYAVGFRRVAKLEKALWCRGKARDAILSICNLNERG